MAPRAIKWLCNGALWVLICCAVALTIIASPQRRRPAPNKPRIDYSRFSHLTEQHRAACKSCHIFPSKNWKQVRKGDEAFPDITEYPEHQACLGCHRQQFFARERPVPRICSNCHVKATPVDTARYAFPSLGEPFLSTAKGRDFASDFRVLFPHDKHADAGCEDCHKPYQAQAKGMFQTRPITHAGCFTCHNQESELAPLPPNCDACHKPPAAEKRTKDFDEKVSGTMGVQDWWTLTAWRNRISAGAFQHEVHSDLKCAQCHQGATMNVVPVKSCGGAEGCHITATSDEGGILNYEIDQRNKTSTFVCTKCHIVFGSKPVPVSHISAIPKAAK